MMDFPDILRNAVEADVLVSMVLSKPCGNCWVSEKLTVRPIEVRGTRLYQWTSRSEMQETHENLAAEETIQRACRLFGESYLHCHVFTSEADYGVRANRKGKVKITKKPPSKSATARGVHNRAKNYLIPENQPCSFLEAIGVMTPAGKVKASQYRKFRQINRYLEFVNDVIPHLTSEGVLKVVDFGCGKSYLTFALHHLLSSVHNRDVRIVGLDQKADVVQDCRAIAKRLGCEGLEFREGDLWHHDEDEIHLAVSLHACDTATDEALAKAVSWKANVILAVPCCQKEIARLLPAEVFPWVQSYGIFKDRLAAMLTDTLRAKALESLGYKTQVVEFIDMEHTAKNVLIRGIRRPQSGGELEKARASYEDFKRDIGIESFHLDRALAEIVQEQPELASDGKN